MFCTACGHVNDGDGGVCARCAGPIQPTPTGPFAKCAKCGATTFGASGVHACKYCGSPVEISATASGWRPPQDDPFADYDPELLAMREKVTAGNTNVALPLVIGIVVMFVFVAIAIAAGESKRHKSQSKYTSRGTTAASPTSTWATSTVYKPPRFLPIARKATVVAQHGALPFSGTTCDLRVWALDSPKYCRAWVTCGSLRVYGSADSWLTCGPTGAAATWLSDKDPTFKDADPQLQVDLALGTATLADTSLAGDSYSVSFGLTSTTDPPPPAPPTFDTVTRTATVTSAKGAIPFSSSTCLLSVSPLPNPDRCNVLLTCGSKRVYGSPTSTTRCEASNAGPMLLTDWKPTPKDNDAKLQADLARGVLALADETRSGDTYLVTFKLTK